MIPRPLPTFAPPKSRTPFPPRLRSPIWKSPLRPGKLKAYDEALKYIRTDALNLRRELAELKHKFADDAAKRAKAGLGHDEPTLKQYRERLAILEVQSKINLPEVRWAFRTGKYPFQIPVYRHLAEQKWRGDGTLDLLMERLHQMHVIPDLLPSLHPTVDLRVQFPRSSPRPAFANVEPGSFLLPEQTRSPPRMAATAFHSDSRLYTMLLLDPDVPDESTSSFQTFLHWIQPNIKLSATRRISHIPYTAHLPYIPPHPQRGTPYHRYVLLLLPHAVPTEQLAIPIPPEAERFRFNLRAFMARWGLDRVPGGGAHMWREVWDKNVSALYRDVLKVPEPLFRRPPKPDPYAEVKRAGKLHYLL